MKYDFVAARRGKLQQKLRDPTQRSPFIRSSAKGKNVWFGSIFEAFSIIKVHFYHLSPQLKIILRSIWEGPRVWRSGGERSRAGAGVFYQVKGQRSRLPGDFRALPPSLCCTCPHCQRCLCDQPANSPDLSSEASPETKRFPHFLIHQSECNESI